MKNTGIKTKAGALIVMILAVAVLFLIPTSVMAGNLEPSEAPGPTMKTLDEIPPSWHQILPADKRFVLAMNDEAVLDKETGLVWARNANLFGEKSWHIAQSDCCNVIIGGRKGWRIPTIDELTSLVDTTQSAPALPSGHPFINVQSDGYWSGTSNVNDTDRGWSVLMNTGFATEYGVKTGLNYVWPVRGGE